MRGSVVFFGMFSCCCVPPFVQASIKECEFSWVDYIRFAGGSAFEFARLCSGSAGGSTTLWVRVGGSMCLYVENMSTSYDICLRVGFYIHSFVCTYVLVCIYVLSTNKYKSKCERGEVQRGGRWQYVEQSSKLP